MLISFAVTNFRSIFERQEVSFLPTESYSEAEGLITFAADEAVLPLIAIFGANASGKTNMLKALHTLHFLIGFSYTRLQPDDDLPSDPHFFHDDEPSTFECVFVLSGERYRLDFTLDKQRVIAEHLYKGESMIYARRQNTFRFSRAYIGLKTIKNLARQNSLFLSAAAQANNQEFRTIQKWFSSWQTVTENRSREQFLTGAMLRTNKVNRLFAATLGSISRDIVGLESPDIDEGGFANTDILDSSERRRQESEEAWTRTVVLHESADGRKIAKVLLPDESKGTQAYLSLIGILITVLGQGSLLIWDEADQSLHPSLLKAVVALFMNPTTNPKGAQVILNTHDTTLLTPDVLRPDQAWFAERDERLTTHFTCLSDFAGIGADTIAGRAYLEGRFGALPVLDDHNRVFSDFFSHLRRRRKSAGKKTNTTKSKV